MGLLQRIFRREPVPETACPRCGVPAPPDAVECTACGWDLREAYRDEPDASTAEPGR